MGAGTANTELSMALTEQHVAQALHLCLLASLSLLDAAGVADADESISVCAAFSWCLFEAAAPESWCAAGAAARTWVLALPPWWLGPQNAMFAAASPCAGIASTNNQMNSTRIDLTMKAV